MTLTSVRRSARPAFTLVEVLVVIAIIAVLYSLLIAAASSALTRAQEDRARNDVTQLQLMLTNAQIALKAPYLPSRMRLREAGDYDLTINGVSGQPNTPVEFETYRFLSTIWPKVTWTNPFDWNNNGSTLATETYDLYGEHCLTFWLGGVERQFIAGPPTIPNGVITGVRGFSTNVTDPIAAGGTRIGPFYDFKPGRLSSTTALATYLDSFGQQPYVYFSSRGNNNYSNDCSSAVSYYSANPRSFQIICAGTNGVFGNAGTGWSPGGAASTYPPGSGGADDIANFHPLVLGAAAN
jgi:prepilin-type N-terminal cleavage/methylation domain-containing protein